MYERQEPWAGRNENFIERQVTGGQFLPVTEPNHEDNTRVVIASVIQSLFNTTASRRPTLAAVSNRLASLQ